MIESQHFTRRNPEEAVTGAAESGDYLDKTPHAGQARERRSGRPSTHADALCRRRPVRPWSICVGPDTPNAGGCVESGFNSALPVVRNENGRRLPQLRLETLVTPRERSAVFKALELASSSSISERKPGDDQRRTASSAQALVRLAWDVFHHPVCMVPARAQEPLRALCLPVYADHAWIIRDMMRAVRGDLARVARHYLRLHKGVRDIDADLFTRFALFGADDALGRAVRKFDALYAGDELKRHPLYTAVQRQWRDDAHDNQPPRATGGRAPRPARPAGDRPPDEGTRGRLPAPAARVVTPAPSDFSSLSTEGLKSGVGTPGPARSGEADDRARRRDGTAGWPMLSASAAHCMTSRDPAVSLDELAVYLATTPDELVALARQLAQGAERFYAPRLVRAKRKPWRPGARRKRRLTYEPCELLKKLQRELAGLLRCYLQPSPIGHSDPIAAVEQHARRLWVLSCDIVDCFPSIGADLIEGTLSRFPSQIRKLVVALTTRRRRLVPGAPTSPVLAELVLGPSDRVLTEIATRLGVRITRYADDYTISGLDRDAVLAMSQEVLRVLAELGLRLRIGAPIPRSRPQRALGVILNNGISIAQADRRATRSWVRAVRRSGPLSSEQRRTVVGVIAWVRRLHPSEASKLERMLGARLEQVVAPRKMTAPFAFEPLPTTMV